MAETTTPIFLLSLPRSGSTLLQRLLATHPAAATTSEPWLLLPLFLGFREGHVMATYRQRHLAAAFDDFLKAIPDGAERQRRAIRAFASTLYAGACPLDKTHFIDKTPRYHLIASELLATFPEAHFVLLWRNPLAVAASCLATWHGGRFALDDHRLDLYDGLANLVDVARSHASRFFTLRYEDLVTDPGSALDGVFEHCGMAPWAAASERLDTVPLEGRMGDRSAAARSRVSAATRDTWTGRLASPPRRVWARRYLRWIGRDRLRVMGYDLDALLEHLAAEPLRLGSTLPDLFWMAYGRASLLGQSPFRRRRRLLARQGRTPFAPFE